MKPAHGGVGRPGPGHPPAPFHARQDRGFLAADKRPGALLDLNIEGEEAVQNIVSQQAGIPALVDGVFQPLEREGILRPAVNVALAGPDRVGGDDHAFKDAERVAFENRPVHEGPGIALVGIADDVLLGADGVLGHAPFLAGEEPRAAPSAKPGGQHFFADLDGRHGVERLGRRAEDPGGNRRIERRGVDLPAVFQDDLLLMAEERDLPDGRDVGEGPLSFADPAQEKTVPEVPAHEDLFQEFMGRFGSQVAIGEAGAAPRQHVHKHFALAVPHATHLDHRCGDAPGGEKSFDLVHDFSGPVGQSAGPGADEEKSALAPPAGSSQAPGPKGAAFLVGVADGSACHAFNQVLAGIGPRVPALAATGCDQRRWFHLSTSKVFRIFSSFSGVR